MPPEFVRRILGDFNNGTLNVAQAAICLEVSRARIYQMRADVLRDRSPVSPRPAVGATRRNGRPDHRFRRRIPALVPAAQLPVGRRRIGTSPSEKPSAFEPSQVPSIPSPDSTTVYRNTQTPDFP
jgi:hypothetical protein